MAGKKNSSPLSTATAPAVAVVAKEAALVVNEAETLVAAAAEQAAKDAAAAELAAAEKAATDQAAAELAAKEAADAELAAAEQAAKDALAAQPEAEAGYPCQVVIRNNGGFPLVCAINGVYVGGGGTATVTFHGRAQGQTIVDNLKAEAEKSCSAHTLAFEGLPSDLTV